MYCPNSRGATIEVAPGVEVPEVMVAAISSGTWPTILLIAAEGSPSATGDRRYTFDNLRADDLYAFVASIYEGRFTISTRRFPFSTISMEVFFKNDSYRVVDSFGRGDLDQPEADALHRV